MKATNKQQVINYLTKASQHTFSYEDGKLFKIVKIGDGFYELDEDSYSKVKPIETNWYVDIYQSNAKCVIKHRLFLNKNLKSVKSNKFNKERVQNYFITEKEI